MKSANVTVRVEPDVKEKAEAILNELGIPTSTAINMFYRQIVLWNGLPFRPAKPPIRPLSRDEMTDEVFNARMAEGLAQARENQSVTIEEAFGEMMGEIRRAKRNERRAISILEQSEMLIFYALTRGICIRASPTSSRERESRGNASGRFKGSDLGFPLYCLCTTKHSGAPAPAFKNRWCSTLYSCGRSADRYAISAARSSSPAA